jgi:hypothetical protein
MSGVTRFHNFAKNIETAQLGTYYTTFIDGLDYYVVESAAKPILAKAPEWLSDNRVVSTIKDQKCLVILAGSIITFVLFMIWLHPKGGAPKPIDPDLTGKKPLPSDKKEGSDVEDPNKAKLRTSGSQPLGNNPAKSGDRPRANSADYAHDLARSKITLRPLNARKNSGADAGTPLRIVDLTIGDEGELTESSDKDLLNNNNNRLPLDHTAGESERQERLKNKLTSFLSTTTITNNTTGGTTPEIEVKESLTADKTHIGSDNGVENSDKDLLNNNNNRSRSSSAPLNIPGQINRKERIIRNLSPMTAAANDATENTISEIIEDKI